MIKSKNLQIGHKDDHQKLQWRLLPIKPLQEVIKVLMYGKDKYGEGNWQKVSEAKDRYYDALMRHITSWRSGERCDLESKLPHLAHVASNALFLLWFEITNLYDSKKKKRFLR